MEKKDALVMVLERNIFYKRLHYLVLAALALSIMVIGILTWIVLFLLSNPSHPLYFATDHVGRLVHIVPVNIPNMKNEDVMAWSIEAVQSAYSYDYINYRAQLQNAQKYFTNYGWSKYMSALSASNNLLALTQRKMIVLANVVGTPKILTEGRLSGAYAWKIQMPVLVTYFYPPYDDKSQFSNALQVNLIVQRQLALQGYKGLGIVQLIGSIAS
jgi:intracellular multiplication protein IcmL